MADAQAFAAVAAMAPVNADMVAHGRAAIATLPFFSELGLDEDEKFLESLGRRARL